jgi:hypothetical protein
MSSISTASYASKINTEMNGQDVGISVLKRAIDASSQSTLTLINNLPTPQRLPDHLGKNINTVT